MKKHFTLLLLYSLAVISAIAQQPFVTLNGHVINQETGAPVAGQTMFISVDSTNLPGYFNQVVTDETGYYTDQIPIKPGMMQGVIFVYTSGCDGTMTSGTGYFYPGTLEVTIDFSICSITTQGCMASFKSQPSSNDMLTFAFIDNSYAIPGATISNWSWDFGDGTFSTEQNPVHSYAEPGLYNTCLFISSNDSQCSSSFCMPVEAGSTNPGPCENTFWYRNDSTGTGYIFEGWVMNGQADNWNWDFGDGTIATGQTVSHSFASPNINYTVCLTTSGAGPDGTTCTSTSCQDIFIFIPSPCESSFWYYPDSSGTGYTFEGWAQNNQIESWAWDFGDGVTGTGQQVTHTFASVNQGTIFNVCLTTFANDPLTNDSCISTSCQAIIPGGTVSSCEAIMSALPDSSGYTFQFKDLSQGYHSFISWDFGDGQLSNEANPVHSYAAPGIYWACLTIADSLNNCWNQTCQEIWVNSAQPGCQASFFAFPADSVPASLSYKFINTSEPGYSSHKWSFGDGTASADYSPVHTFATPGLYNVCLTIWDSAGYCQSTFCLEIFAGEANGNYIISGNVLAGNTVADQGIVWLIGNNNYYYAETLIDSAGTYNFSGVPAGSYYIYAMLTPGSPEFFAYMPTYYVNSLTWQGATVVSSGEPNAFYPISLVPSIFWSQGNASITGNINWGGTFKSEGNPAANVEVVLFNNAGVPIAYAFSNNDGSFEFNNLPYGEYTLHAEMTGKITETVVVILSENSSTAHINFVVTASAISLLGSNDPASPNLIAGNPYPNPVGETLYLDLQTTAPGNAIIEIIDLYGRIIRTESIVLTGGTKRISITTGDLTNGVYLLKVKTEGRESLLRRFIR